MRYIIILLLLTGCSLKRSVGPVQQSHTQNPPQIQFTDLDVNQDGNISKQEFEVQNVNVNTTAPWIGLLIIVSCVFVLTVGLAALYRSKQHNL